MQTMHSSINQSYMQNLEKNENVEIPALHAIEKKI